MIITLVKILLIVGIGGLGYIMAGALGEKYLSKSILLVTVFCVVQPLAEWLQYISGKIAPAVEKANTFMDLMGRLF